MAGRIPQNLLEDILGRVDIVELILGYIPLKRSGRNFKTNCPFHHEKTPSFTVSPDRQIYHCFGCGAGGNAFSFLMQYERLEFLEAVETLAKKAGVNLPQIQKQDPGVSNLITQLYKVNELATAFYADNLNASTGSQVRNYLLKRGIKEESIKLFKLGFAPDKWDSLINYFRAKGVSLSILEKAGLVLAKGSGGYYDRFRNRVIFPIFDIKSRTLGFGARLLPEGANPDSGNTQAKYINSPETAIYIKGRNLYGLDLSKDYIRDADCAIVVEGYLDFLAPFEEGVKNIVASLGTALTQEQARLLKRYTHNIVMIYDPDDAGQIATLRTLDVFIEEEMDVRVVSLPKGFDPDLFVRQEGIEAFKEKIKNAQGLFDYKLEVLKSRFDIKEAQGKAKIASEMLPTINRFKNAILKAEYIKLLSAGLNVEEQYVLQELKKIKGEKAYLDISQTAPKKLANINPTEKLLIKMMLDEADTISRVKEMLQPDDFKGEITSKIVSLMFDLASQGKSIKPSHLINYFGEEDISRLISESTLMPEISSENRERIIDDCIIRLKSDRLKVRKQHLQEEITTAQRLGNDEKLHLLIEEFNNLTKMR
ncbi:MAG: DNA primase [Candidatus Omnitrophota bacterium]